MAAGFTRFDLQGLERIAKPIADRRDRNQWQENERGQWRINRDKHADRNHHVNELARNIERPIARVLRLLRVVTQGVQGLADGSRDGLGSGQFQDATHQVQAQQPA